MATGLETPGAGREDREARGSPHSDPLRWPPILEGAFDSAPVVVVRDAEEFDVVATVHESPFVRLNNIVGVCLWLLMFPPAGMYFLWKSGSISRTAKEVVTSFLVIALIIALMVGFLVLANPAELMRDLQMSLPEIRPMPFMVYP